MSEDSEEQYFLFGCSGKFTVGPISVVGWLEGNKDFCFRCAGSMACLQCRAAQGVIESLKVLEVRVEPIIPMIVGV